MTPYPSQSAPAQPVEHFQVTTNPGIPPDVREQVFEARLLREVQTRWDLTKTSRPRRYYLHLVAALFAKAIHYVSWNHRTGMVEEWSQEKIAKCMYTPVPLLEYAVETIAAQYTNSNPRIVPMPADKNDPKTKAVVRVLTDFADYLDFEFYRADPYQRQTEAKMIPLRGAYNFLEWDKKGGAKLQLPQYEGEQGLLCTDCGYEVPQGEQACPHCGSTNIQPAMTGMTNAGPADTYAGCVRRHLVDPFQVEIYDRNRGIEESPYLIYDDIEFKTRILRRYPWLKAITGNAPLGNSNEGFLGIHYLLQLQTAVSNTGRLDQSQPDYLGMGAFTSSYAGSFLNESLCWRRRAWLDPEEYADWTTGDRPTQFPGDNRVIPPNTPVAPMFPDGLLLHIINGNQVVKLENQSKNAVWVYIAYRPSAEGLVGAGVNPLVSLNRGYDEANSFEMQALLMAALGIVIADERVKNIRNIPGSVATIPISARLPNESIMSLVGRLDMGGAQAISAAEPLKQGYRANFADLSMTASPNASNLDREGMGTATGVRYQSGAVNTLTGPPMELYSGAKAQVIEKAIALTRVHGIRPFMFGKYGETATRWLDPIVIPEKLRFGAAEDSWRPRTIETEREEVGAAIQLGIGLAEFTNPAVEDKAMRVFGLDSDTDDYEDWVVRGEKRLDALKAALPLAMQEAQQMAAQLASLPPEEQAQWQEAQEQGLIPTPEQAVAKRLIELAGVTPRPLDMDGHIHYVRFWKEIYNTDEFDSFPPPLQDAIEELYIMSQDGIGQAMAVATDQATTAQGPAMEAQAKMAAQQAQVEAQAGGQADAAKIEGEMALQQGEMALKAKEMEGKEKEIKAKTAESARDEKAAKGEHERTEKEEKLTHSNTLEIEKLKHKNAMELETKKAAARKQQAAQQAAKAKQSKAKSKSSSSKKRR